MVQIARPSSDITANWTPTTGSTHWGCIDETSANDDTDAIDTGSDPVSLVCEVKFSSLTDPVSSSGHVVRYRFRRGPQGGKTVSLIANLRQGSTSIASWTHLDAAIVNTYTTFQQTLSSGEADSITDYTDLRLRLTANTTGGGSGTGVRFTWTEIEVPDAGAPTISPSPVTVPALVVSPTLLASATIALSAVVTPMVVIAPTLSDEVSAIMGAPPTFLYFFLFGVPTSVGTINALPVSIPIVAVSPTLSASITVAPGAVIASISAAAPALSALVTITPDVVISSISVAIVGLSASSTIISNAVAVTASVVEPTLSAGEVMVDVGSFFLFPPLLFQVAAIDESELSEESSAHWFGIPLFLSSASVE